MSYFERLGRTPFAGESVSDFLLELVNDEFYFIPAQRELEKVRFGCFLISTLYMYCTRVYICPSNVLCMHLI